MKEKKRITNKELIIYCRQQDSEVCNECPYLMKECSEFFKQVGRVPSLVGNEEMTEKE